MLQRPQTATDRRIWSDGFSGEFRAFPATFGFDPATGTVASPCVAAIWVVFFVGMPLRNLQKPFHGLVAHGLGKSHS